MVEAENRSRRALLLSLGSWGTAYQTAIFTVLTEASAWSDNRVFVAACARRLQATGGETPPQHLRHPSGRS